MVTVLGATFERLPLRAYSEQMGGYRTTSSFTFFGCEMIGQQCASLRRGGLLVLQLLIAGTAMAASPTPFVPKDFAVPTTLETTEFRLRMLTVNDVVKDFDAVITSTEHLKTIWPGTWPAGLTLEQNLIDLGWHQKEFQTRRSFAFTVVDPSGERVLGCVYIEPTRKRGYDAEVYLWARQSELAKGLETRLYDAVKKWVTDDWPFEGAAYPGRDIDWERWLKIPDETR